MFKVNKKITRTTSTYFTPSSSVSIVDFEHVNVIWGGMLKFYFSEKCLRINSPYHILCIIFQEKYFSCYIVLTEQVSLPDCLNF